VTKFVVYTQGEGSGLVVGQNGSFLADCEEEGMGGKGTIEGGCGGKRSLSYK